MNQQTVYKTVSVQDELPERVGEYYVRVEDYKAVGILDGSNFYADDKNLYATHWEKPTTGYFLTPEEMEDVIKEAREQAIREAAEGFVINPGSFGEGEYKPPFIEQESILNLLK